MVSTVLLVEDDPECLGQLSAALREAPDLALVGTAQTYQEGLKQLRRLKPDILLTDLRLPDGSGLDLIKVAREDDPGPDILVLTVFGDHRAVMPCLRAGANGYLIKGGDTADIAAQVRTLKDGGSPVSPMVSRLMLKELWPQSPGIEAGEQALSIREREALQLCAKGCNYAEVAHHMNVKLPTVQTYMKRSFKKLHAKNKSEAIHEARARRELD